MYIGDMVRKKGLNKPKTLTRRKKKKVLFVACRFLLYIPDDVISVRTECRFERICGLRTCLQTNYRRQTEVVVFLALI